MSRTLLGQIELGRTVPSIGVTWRISQALGVPFSALLSTAHGGPLQVLTRTDAKTLHSADGRFVSRALFPFGEPHAAEFYELWLAGHAREDADAHRPGTVENLVVTAGRLKLTVAPTAWSSPPATRSCSTPTCPTATSTRAPSRA